MTNEELKRRVAELEKRVDVLMETNLLLLKQLAASQCPPVYPMVPIQPWMPQYPCTPYPGYGGMPVVTCGNIERTSTAAMN